MPKQSRRRRNAGSNRAESRKHAEKPRKPQAQDAGQTTPEKTVAVLHEAAQAANPFQPMERFLQAFMPFAWFRPWMEMPHTPKLDVIDRDGSVLVRAEVPGVQKSHLEVEASDTAVTIKGEVMHAEAQGDEDHYRISEINRGSFERTVRMPTDVDSTRAKATFKDGVLEVMLPKVDRSRSHHVKV